MLAEARTLSPCSQPRIQPGLSMFCQKPEVIFFFFSFSFQVWKIPAAAELELLSKHWIPIKDGILLFFKKKKKRKERHLSALERVCARLYMCVHACVQACGV